MRRMLVDRPAATGHTNRAAEHKDRLASTALERPHPQPWFVPAGAASGFAQIEVIPYEKGVLGGAFEAGRALLPFPKPRALLEALNPTAATVTVRDSNSTQIVRNCAQGWECQDGYTPPAADVAKAAEAQRKAQGAIDKFNRQSGQCLRSQTAGSIAAVLKGQSAESIWAVLAAEAELLCEPAAPAHELVDAADNVDKLLGAASLAGLDIARAVAGGHGGPAALSPVTRSFELIAALAWREKAELEHN